MTGKYKKPAHFRDALKSRLKRRARQRGMLYNRYRQLFLFERFASRIYQACGDQAVLKGGLVLELRLERARTTKDIDIRLEGQLDEQLTNLRKVATKVGDDYLRFELADGEKLTEMIGDQILYEGRRVDVRARLAGSPFGDPFHIDISMADALVVEPEIRPGDDLLTFIDIEPLEHRIYPKEAHVAEKLHAWSQPRNKPNSRMKDIVDIGLFAAHEPFEFPPLRASIEATFAARDTHPIPRKTPDSPTDWRHRFNAIRERDGLQWSDFDELEALVQRFIRPVIDNEPDDNQTWSPKEQSWQ